MVEIFLSLFALLPDYIKQTSANISINTGFCVGVVLGGGGLGCTGIT